MLRDRRACLERALVTDKREFTLPLDCRVSLKGNSLVEMAYLIKNFFFARRTQRRALQPTTSFQEVRTLYMAFQ